MLASAYYTLYLIDYINLYIIGYNNKNSHSVLLVRTWNQI